MQSGNTGKRLAMIRVTKTQEPARTTVTVDGQLLADSIDVVEHCCSQAELDGKPVWVFLRDVTIVDHHGRQLLARLAAKGVRLVASGVYTSYLVQAITLAATPLESHPAAEVGNGKPPRRAR